MFGWQPLTEYDHVGSECPFCCLRLSNLVVDWLAVEIVFESQWGDSMTDLIVNLDERIVDEPVDVKGLSNLSKNFGSEF